MESKYAGDNLDGYAFKGFLDAKKSAALNSALMSGVEGFLSSVLPNSTAYASLDGDNFSVEVSVDGGPLLQVSISSAIDRELEWLSLDGEPTRSLQDWKKGLQSQLDRINKSLADISRD